MFFQSRPAICADYPIAKYADFENECPFTFEMNSEAVIKGEKDCGFTITYPKMKATIYLTYKPVNNNINVLLRDSKVDIRARYKSR
jgi:gliding motility-associated lipoprotein GldD